MTRDKEYSIIYNLYLNYNLALNKEYYVKEPIKIIKNIDFTKFHRITFSPIKEIIKYEFN